MKRLTILLLSTLFYNASQAAQTTVTVSSTGNDAKEIGQVVFEDSDFGLLITPNLTSLPPGLHGFHLHQHPDCGDHGMDAGGHFDPTKTNTHLGPYGKGHLGDLPVLYVDANGKASTPILAPRLKTTDLQGLSLMIHGGGDNYSDNPPLGGGGPRIACGPVK